MGRGFYFGISVLIAGVGHSCSRPAIPTPPVAIPSTAIRPAVPSMITIPAVLQFRVLEEILNAKLSGLIYHDATFDDGDRMKIKVFRRNPIRINGQDDAFRFRIPLYIEVVYDAFVTQVSASGEIELDARSEFRIGKDWSGKTETALHNYRWISKPVAQVGGITFPIATLSDLILSRSRSYLGQEMDSIVAGYFDLKAIALSSWKSMSGLFYLSPEYKAWLSLNPAQLAISPIRIRGDSLHLAISLKANPAIAIGNQPGVPELKPVPEAKVQPMGEEKTQIILRTRIPFDQARNLTLQQVGGQTYTSGRKSVKVQDVRFFAVAPKLGVEITLSGSYKGKIFLIGTPESDGLTNRIALPDLDFYLETRNLLYRTAGWMLKDDLRKKFQESIRLQVALNLEETRQALEKTWDGCALADGFILKAKVSKLSIEQIQVLSDGILADVGMLGDLSVRTSGQSQRR